MRLAEESVQKKMEELEQFFNVTLDLLCIANNDGYFLRLNSSWEKNRGYSREHLGVEVKSACFERGFFSLTI
jgi:PAS domain-containing protein